MRASSGLTAVGILGTGGGYCRGGSRSRVEEAIEIRDRERGFAVSWVRQDPLTYFYRSLLNSLRLKRLEQSFAASIVFPFQEVVFLWIAHRRQYGFL